MEILKTLLASFGAIVILVLMYALIRIFLYFTKRDRILKLSYWRCLFFHELHPVEYWKMAPCGIGGGSNAWALRCTECKCSFDITESRYRGLKEKI